MSREIDLALGLLDHQLVDSDGRRCGKVDDLELDVGDRPHVVEILVGRRRRVHVPWDAVARVRADVELKQPARALRLGRGDDAARKYVEWVPGSHAPE